MKRLNLTLLAALLVAGMSCAAAAQTDASLSYSTAVGKSNPAQRPDVFVAPTGTGCDASTPGIIIHDDGQSENGYGFNAATVTEGRLVDKFTPTNYPATFSRACFAFITNTGLTSANIEIVIYADDGAGGIPGTLLGSQPVVVVPTAISGLPFTPTFQSFDISGLNLNITSGSVYIGVKWIPTGLAGLFIGSDETPATAHASGKFWANTGPWQEMGNGGAINPAYRALNVRAVQGSLGPGAPSLSKAFAPTQVLANVPSTLTLTLRNTTQPTAAVLNTVLTDTFPTGLVVAATPAASTTCSGGTVTAVAGSGSVSLSTGATIPANGTCTVTVNVSSPADSTYVNTIPAGALKTNHGDSPSAATATLKVGFTFPEPYCPAAFSNAVEPITKVVVAGISKTSSATVNGTPALENFTATLGAVSPGLAYPITVEGNTDGNFTTQVKAYADWNNNGVFTDAGEAYTIGAIVNSTGVDGIQAASTINVPAGATPGDTRFRVIKLFGTTANPQPCNTAGYGQAEDYTLTVNAGSGNPPAATVTPASLTLTAPSGGTATDTIAIANAAGSNPLTWSIEARGASAPILQAYSSKAALRDPIVAMRLSQQAVRQNKFTTSGISGLHSAERPWVPAGSILFSLDDGGYENAIGWTDQATDTENAAIWVNRFTASSALTIDSVSILWPTINVGTVVGKQVNLVAYYDADGDGDPGNAVRLGTDNLITIASLDAFLTYTTSFTVPAAGDVYIGFVNSYANGGTTPALYPAAIDQTASAGRSYVAANDVGDANLDIGQNDFVGTIDSAAPALAGNWLIRATGSGGGSGGACTGPIVTWLTATPASGSTLGGATTNVSISANAATLAAGVHNAELCITTNDPAQALIAIPVTLTVQANDLIFKDGFDAPAVFTQPIQDPSFETTTGDGGSNASWAGDDTNDPGGTPFYSSGFAARTGTWKVWFGGWGSAASTQTASQSVMLSSGGPRYLKYWRAVTVAPVGTATLTIYVDGTPVETTNVVANGIDPGWVSKSVDISSFANGTSRSIKLEYVVAGSADGNVFIDDVTVEATP